MGYAAVLTHVQADAGPRLACAVNVARRFSAAVVGVGAEAITPFTIDAGGYPHLADWVAADRASIDARLKVAHEAFVAATEHGAVRGLWSCSIDLPGAAVATASRAADLIVAGGAPRRASDPYFDADIAELALTSGRPVLVAPSDGRPLEAQRIVVAWKDTREARRALTDAMPFLEKAERVVVVTICPDFDAEEAALAAEDVAAALRRRGVNADAKVVRHSHPDGAQLLDQASFVAADLIVMGAYGHTRLGEWVFGGMTRDLLRQDDVYLLLSH